MAPEQARRVVTSTHRAPDLDHRRGFHPAVLVALRLIIAAGLAIDAYLHLAVASDYDVIPGTISAGMLFRVEAIVAIVIAILVLVFPGRIAYVLAFLVGASAFAAAVINTYVDLGAVGPLPNLYEPVWFTEKAASAIAEGVVALAAAAAFLIATPHHHTVVPELAD